MIYNILMFHFHRILIVFIYILSLWKNNIGFIAEANYKFTILIIYNLNHTFFKIRIYKIKYINNINTIKKIVMIY